MNEGPRAGVLRRVLNPQIAKHALPLALILSLGLHAGVALTVRSMATVPQLDFQFAMPDQVEFGMTEAMDVALVDSAPPSPVPEPEVATPLTGDREGEGPGPAAPDAGVPDQEHTEAIGLDAGVPEPAAGLDGGVPEPLADGGAPPHSDAGVDGGVDGGVGDSVDGGAAVDAGPARPRIPLANATIRGPARIPAGAQLALRLDMARLRQSAVASDIRALIAAVPDWQELLGGSGIDPLDDLERVLIATPNRYRSRIMVAGRHIHDEAFTRAVVDRMATARSTQVTWSTREGVPVAPWANEGATPRELAVLGPQHFTISRPEDLAVVLAMTQARAEREAEGLEEASGPDVLLSMGPGEGLSLEVEGVHAFLAGGDPAVIPLRARLAIREVGPRMVGIDGLAVFPSAQLAADAVTYWSAQREAALSNMMVRMMLGNLAGVLQSFTFEPDGERVEIRGRASVDDLRRALAIVRAQFESWAREAERRRQAGAAPGGAGTTPGARSDAPGAPSERGGANGGSDATNPPPAPAADGAPAPR
jgi:hypothetical protein